MGRFSRTVHFFPVNVLFPGAVLGLQLLAWLINSQNDNCSLIFGKIGSRKCLQTLKNRPGNVCRKFLQFTEIPGNLMVSCRAVTSTRVGMGRVLGRGKKELTTGVCCLKMDWTDFVVMFILWTCFGHFCLSQQMIIYDNIWYMIIYNIKGVQKKMSSLKI